jgi:predicted nucleic acid-binding protein
VHGRIALTGWALNGGVAVLDLGEEVLAELDRLLRQYRDRPMDLADASLVLLAERTGLTEILTIDRADFDVYRLADGRPFQQVMPSK